MQRILIIGASGSGKSTLAQRVSARLGIPYFATDPFYWGADWKPIPMQQVREKLHSVLTQDAWVLDGNFDDERHLLWNSADCIVWLDYPLPLVLTRVILRNLGWFLRREVTWAGNRMSFKRAVSGIRHSVRSVRGKRAVYPGYLAALQCMDKVHRFRTNRQTERWFASLQSSQEKET